MYEIIPLRSAGNLRFGLPRLDVRSALGAQFRSLKRTPSAAPCDQFPALGLFAYYDGRENLNAVEFGKPADPVWNGHHLLRVTYRQLCSVLSAIDQHLEINADNIISRSLGVSAYCPNAKDNPLAPCESVLAFAQGYYD
jgi:hypothetical protein